jgi:hypothetical protein
MGALTDALAGTNLYGDFLYPLLNGGFYHYLFPFMLVYAIVLTILTKVDIFKENKAVRVIISLVFALFSITFPITSGYCDANGYSGFSSTYGGCTLGDFMIVLFPGVTAFTIGILALYIVAAMMGVDLMSFLGNDKKNQKVMRYILGGLGILVVVYYYARGFGWGGLDQSFWLWQLLQDPFLYMLIIFILIFWWVSSEEKPTKGAVKGD